MYIVLAYTVAIVAAEIATTFAFPLWGILGHVAIFIALVIHSAVDLMFPYRRLLLSLTLVPLVRIISLSMPLSDLPQIWWYPIIYAPLLVATLVLIRINDLKPNRIGLVLTKIPLQAVILLIGVPLGVVEYFILRPEAIVTTLSWREVWLPALILVVSTGFVEELIFRGVLQRVALDSMKKGAIIYVSFLFAVLHIGYMSWVDFAFVFGVAVLFGWLVIKTGSLLGVSLAHGITNVTLYVVMPFLVK